MHSAIFSSFASVWADGCVCVPGPGGPPAGRSLWHLSWAALNAGADGSTPLVLNVNPPPTFGSGKLGTPFARIHLENATPDGAPVTAAAVVLGAVAVLDPALTAPSPATALGLGALPPHPASRTAVATVVSASERARRDPIGMITPAPRTQPIARDGIAGFGTWAAMPRLTPGCNSRLGAPGGGPIGSGLLGLAPAG